MYVRMKNSVNYQLKMHDKSASLTGKAPVDKYSPVPKKLRVLLPFFLFTCLIMASSGCSAQQKKPRQQPASRVFLVFQKTPCLGVCPSYEATIYENGSITFVGWEHVPVKDTLHLKFSPKEMQSLRQQVSQLNYASLQNAYLTQWSDMPSTISTFYVEGRQVKRIKHQEAGPAKLVQFQEELHHKIMLLVEEEAQKRLPVR